MGVCSLFRLRSASLSINLAPWLLGEKKKKKEGEFRSAIISPLTHSAHSLPLCLDMDERPELLPSELPSQVLGRKKRTTLRQQGIGPSIPAVYWNPSFSPLFVMYTCSALLRAPLFAIAVSHVEVHRRFYWWCAGRADLPLLAIKYYAYPGRYCLRIFYCVGGLHKTMWAEFNRKNPGRSYQEFNFC